MSASRRLKFFAIIVVVVVVVGAVGAYFISSRPVVPSSVTSVLSTTSESQTMTVTPVVTTTASVQTTSLSSVPEEWITLGEVKSLNYYLSLLESNGTQPYVQLARELRKLPDLKNATAVGKITYLALNATNPEVKEAFELMIKGGTPDPRDFPYTVPSWNTELQVLYWLALENDFKMNDTMALAIAMVNGFWLTMGDNQVRQAVYDDTTQLLRHFRETSEIQKQIGYYSLEDYPLEAKICLAWAGGVTPNMGPHPVVWGMWYVDRIPSPGYLTKGIKVDLKAYEWNTVSVPTLREMRRFVREKGWMQTAIGDAVSQMENYFYFENGVFTGKSEHWTYGHPSSGEETYLDVNGTRVLDYNILNVDFMFEYFKATGRGIGMCTDEASWIDALSKSAGIATDIIWRGGPNPSGEWWIQHFHVIYYDPGSRGWKSSASQLGLELNLHPADATVPIYLTFFRPPVRQDMYFKTATNPNGPVFGLWGPNDKIFYHYQKMTTLVEVRDTFLGGLSTVTLKEWLLYSFPAALDSTS